MSNNIIKLIKIAFNAFNINDDEIKDFILIEGFLDFCFKNKFVGNVEKLYVLLTNMHKMGQNDLKEIHYSLDTLRYAYYGLSSKSNYVDLLDKYKRKPAEIRMYEIDGNMLIPINEKKDFSYREIHYKNVLTEGKERTTNVKYSDEIKEYYFEYDRNTINVSFSDINLPKIEFKAEKNKVNKTYSISIKGLIDDAYELDELIDKKISEGYLLKRENYGERIKKSTIKAVNEGKLSNAEKLTINKVCNILGMVGAGKSTIMVVLAYGAAKDGYRICIVLEATKDILDLAYLFKSIGIKSTAVRGESTVYEQIEKVNEDDEMFMPKKYAEELMGTCILDGCLGRNDTFNTIKYGKEPCCSLAAEGRKVKYLCPAYSICPRKKSEREIGEANIIITNMYSFVYGKTHFIKSCGRIPLIEYIISNIDMVMFDEADKVQVTFDKIFCETESVAELLRKNNKQISNMIGECIEGNEEELKRKIINEFVFSINYLGTIRNYIKNNKMISDIPRIKEGKWFSGLILTNLINDFSEELKDSIRNYSIANKDIKEFNSYKYAYIDSENTDNAMEIIKEKYTLSEIGVLKFKFVITLIFFEKSIYNFGNMLQQLNDSNIESLEIPNIFRVPFRSIRKLIPTSPVGNRFGYIYDEEKRDITVFRQFGVGRSIMMDLPYLKIDKYGEGLGPSIVLFSGSSWAEGSYRYHINKEPSYILESNKEVIDFIGKTKCTLVPVKTKVSGSKKKLGAIRELINEARNYIEREIDNNGDILIIVNSYVQCIEAQKELKKLFPNVKVGRLISDKDYEEEDTVKRGKLSELYKENYKILIAPAKSIERGHNIVDEIGHSIFTSLFFLVRPMDVPRDIENIVSTINGAIIEHATLNNGENILENNIKIIDKALELWESMFRNYYSIGNMDSIPKKEIVVSRLVLIVQIFGRLLRIMDCNREIPKIYFVDGAFSGSELNGFNLLEEIIEYLEANIKREDVGEIVNLLYGPFYKALKGGNLNV